MVYQVKQLSESLTGRVEVTHLSENSFGSLMPARGYFHLKSVIDFLSALVRSPACAYVWPSFGVKVLGDTPSLLLCQCLERLLKQAEPCIWGVFHGAGHSPCHVASRCLLWIDGNCTVARPRRTHTTNR